VRVGDGVGVWVGGGVASGVSAVGVAVSARAWVGVRGAGVLAIWGVAVAGASVAVGLRSSLEAIHATGQGS